MAVTELIKSNKSGEAPRKHLVEIVFNLQGNEQFIRTVVTQEEASVIERNLRSTAVRGVTLHDTDGSLIFINLDRISHVTLTPLGVEPDKGDWND